MYGIKLCQALFSRDVLPLTDQIRLLKRLGFDGFFSGWEPGCDIAALRRVADEEGMIYQSIHAPFEKMHSMWYPSEETHSAVAELLGCLRDCAANAVPVMVAHAFIGFEDHTPTQAGLDNFADVVREAERLGVKVAFENTEGEEYLFALMERFKDSPAVGFCWDTGHQLCYNPNTDLMAVFGDRLIATHINDNLGVKDFDGKITWLDDLHLLPFDGINDWPEVAAKIKRSGFSGPLTFELNLRSKPDRHENDAYAAMPFEDYLTQVFIRACRVAALVLRA